MPRKIEYQKRKEMGFCAYCSNKATNGVYCEKCHIKILKKAKEKRVKRSAEGLCVDCLSVREQKNKKRCNACLEKMKNIMEQRRINFIASGKCLECGDDKNPNCKRCNKCYFKMISWNVFSDINKMKHDLLESDFFGSMEEILNYLELKQNNHS
jgi:hypothetical protein